MRGARFERLRAVDAGLARRNPQIDELAIAEQPQVRIGGEERVPLEAGFGDQHFALVVALAASGSANRVASLDRLQRLVAMDDVDRRERALEVRREVFESEAPSVTRGTGRKFPAGPRRF